MGAGAVGRRIVPPGRLNGLDRLCVGLCSASALSLS